MEGRAPSTTETWDAFFSDFYLRAHARASARRAEAQALAAVRLAARPRAATCSTCRAASAATRSRWPARATASPASTARPRCWPRPRRRAPAASAGPKLVQRRLPRAAVRRRVASTPRSTCSPRSATSATRRTRGCWPRSAACCAPAAGWSSRRCTATGSCADFREQDWQLLGEGRLLLEQRTFDPRSGVAQTTQTLIDPAGERDSRTFSVRVYTATELLAMLARAGFAEARCLRRPRRRAVHDRHAPGDRRPAGRRGRRSAERAAAEVVAGRRGQERGQLRALCVRRPSGSPPRRTPKRAHSTDSVRAAFSSAAPTAAACSPASSPGASSTTLPPLSAGALVAHARAPRCARRSSRRRPRPQPGHPTAVGGERRGGVDHEDIDRGQRGDRGPTASSSSRSASRAATDAPSARERGPRRSRRRRRRRAHAVQDPGRQHVEHAADPTSTVCAMELPAPRPADLPLAGGTPGATRPRPPAADRADEGDARLLRAARRASRGMPRARPPHPPVALGLAADPRLPRRASDGRPVPHRHRAARAGRHRHRRRAGPHGQAAFTIEMEPGWAVPHQLRERGVDPDDVELIVMTHLHYDHASGLLAFPGATVVVDTARVGARAHRAADRRLHRPPLPTPANRGCRCPARPRRSTCSATGRPPASPRRATPPATARSILRLAATASCCSPATPPTREDLDENLLPLLTWNDDAYKRRWPGPGLGRRAPGRARRSRVTTRRRGAR